MAGSISVTASGFAALPAQAPANWPTGVVWPGGQLPNGTKTASNVTDADMISILTWSATYHVAQNQGPPVGSPTTVTTGQILVAFVNNWFTGIKQAVQQFFTTPPSVPPQIGLN